MRWVVFILLVAISAGFVYAFYLWQIPPARETFSAELAENTSQSNPCGLKTGKPDFLTKQTCNSTACHGAIRPVDKAAILRNEYRVWFDRDPHAGALRVLGNPASQRMVTYLAGNNPGAGTFQAVYRRCFACHNTTIEKVPDRLVTSEAEFDREPEHEGVGCQACHGPASDWENIHYFDCWKEFTGEKKEQYGLIDTKNLLKRAETCARCHVGESGRDVDHDLIAAGHPQMKFEMAGYLELMPVHWNVETDRSRHTDFERELWAAGQIASVNAALVLLETRAKKTAAADASARRWPEFSEYDCFACHHDLNESTWRQERGFTTTGGRVLLPWGVWHYAILPELARTGQNPAGTDFSTAFEDLEKTMQSGFFPDPLAVARQAETARSALSKWIEAEGLKTPIGQLGKTLNTIRDPVDSPRTWDQAVQLYLAAHVQVHSPDLDLPQDRIVELEARLAVIRDGLGFSDGYQSPKSFPLGLRSKGDVRQLLKELIEELPGDSPPREPAR